MHTSKCRYLIEAGFLPSKSVDNHSLISPTALVDIHLQSYEYGINGLLRFILNGMQNLNAWEDKHIVKSTLQNHVTT